MYSIRSQDNQNKYFRFFKRKFSLRYESNFAVLDHILRHDKLLTTDEKYFARILSEIPHLVSAHDIEGRYTFVNQAFADFAGMKTSGIIGRTDEELNIFLNPEQMRISDQAIFQNGLKQFIPLEPFTDHYGRLYWFQSHKIPVKNKKGEVMEVLTVSMDITQKVKLEQNLTLSELRFRSIFENNYSGIIVVDKDLNVLSKNTAFDMLVNKRVLLSENDDLRNYLSKEDQRDLLDLLNGLSARNYEEFNMELKLFGQDNRILDTVCFVKGLYDDELKFREAVVTFQDVTKERKQQRAIEESEERFRTIVENATEALLLIDYESGSYIDANESALSLFGYTREELLGLKLGKLSPKIQQDGANSVKKTIEHVERAVNGERVVYEWLVQRKDGTKLQCEVRLLRLPYPDKIIVRTSVIDISERKRAEALLNQEKIKLEKSNMDLLELNVKLGAQTKQLQEFAYIASHNLRSPAGNLKALLDFYHTEPNEANLEFLLEKLNIVADDLMNTIDELAKAVQIKNEVAKEVKEISLLKVLDKTLDSMSQIIMEKKAKINVDFDAYELIYAPKTYIDSIFINLISNALKYAHPDRPLKLDIKTLVRNENLEIIFSDNGVGIDLKKYGSKLFGLRKTFHKNKDSRGLGLFISKAQVEALGGNIVVESEPEKGTSFNVLLPKSILRK